MFLFSGIETEREKHTPVKQGTAWEAVLKAMATGWNRDPVCRGITQGGKILQETFIDSYDPSVLRRVQYMLYEIKWSTSKRLWQRCCHSTRTEHAEIHFIEDVFKEQRSDPSVHCSITWYMSWSPCGDCCKQIRDFLKEQPNVNLVIYVARIYWHKEEINRQGLRSLMNIGVSIQVMDLPVYSYCWRTFVNDEDKDEHDYWPRHFAPWIMLYSLELQSILQNIPSCLEISAGENQTPIFSLCVEDEEQKRALASANRMKTETTVKVFVTLMNGTTIRVMVFSVLYRNCPLRMNNCRPCGLGEEALEAPQFVCLPYVSLCAPGDSILFPTDHVSRGIRQGGKISQEAFMENYDPSVLPNETYLLYEIKWSSSKRSWQNCCHNTLSEHAEIYFLEDVFKKQRSDPSDHCSITWYMSWSPCGDCCRAIRGFLKEQPNVNLVIYVARIYLHKEENNRQGLRSLMNIGVSIRVMDLPVYSYCWKTFVDDEDKYKDDYWPRHFAPWIMLYSLELQSILQNIPSCLEISAGENQTPVFSLCVEDEEQKRALTSANP
ncbi:uncharacterized protein LOC119567405 [Chelonia mydas]|uniref:uncharacterized protein LOC119567405 n=1 Tax=Chelonia mydas TaxID=8469 RepID=UPI001CA9EBEC|nr:uncharacterized protein LOC119567405 [Chelonia mydas]